MNRSVSNETRARVMERIRNWGGAAQAWDAAGCPDEAASCRRIIEARRAGDAWRSRVRELVASGLTFESAAKQATEEQANERRSMAGS